MTAPPPLRHAFPHRPPVCHLVRKHADGSFAGPACGQRALDGTSHARTPHTTLPERVTCKKCRRAIERLQHKEATA